MSNQQELIELMVKAISAEIDAASQRSAKEMVNRYSTYVNSKPELEKPLETAFIAGATYVFNRMREQ